ncbi:MAG: putative toxin-antitoxin system toxin component, PIN family [Pseudomonadales bacterium]|nr:putative toxin-antitoxin system toxin component, PIN family [Pseudomonadales bacterium]
MSRSPRCSGAARRIGCSWRSARQSDTIQLFSNESLLSELAEVLNRSYLRQPLATIGRTPIAVLTDYVASVEIVVPTHIPAVARDPDDDQVIACALAANADAIVSGYNDLLVLGNYRSIRILSAREALEFIAT